MKSVSFVAMVATITVAWPCSASDNPAIDGAMLAWSGATTLPTFDYALVDLNDDGVLDAIVLLTEPRYCGSGGCSMVVLRGTGDGFRVLSSSSITRAPVVVLPEKRHGWRTFTVSVAGGGVKAGPVLMRFNGARYPNNPTMAPLATPRQIEGGTSLTLHH